MVSLRLIEESAQQLVFRVGACVMLGHMGICIVIVAVVAASFTAFMRHYIGFLAFVLIGVPGVVGLICGFFGCANAREFTFCFDKTSGEFKATAGSAQFVRPLNQIRLVHIEREIGGGGALGGESAPSFAIALMFFDNRRCRLEGGISTTGSGRGPDELRQHAERIRAFLELPQDGIPLLNISKATRQDEDEEQTRFHLSRWMACQGLAPRLEPPLRAHDWVEQPQGVSAPRGGSQVPTRGQIPAYTGAPVAESSPCIIQGVRSSTVHGAPLVIGRVHQPAPRTFQVTIREGMPGQAASLTTPDGTQLQCTVPGDMQVGETMTLQY